MKALVDVGCTASVLFGVCVDGFLCLQRPGTQKTEFAVSRNPDAIVFAGANIWVANQPGDGVMELSASDRTILGTFPIVELSGRLGNT